jgi:hypothetical protein
MIECLCVIGGVAVGAIAVWLGQSWADYTSWYGLDFLGRKRKP